MLWQASFRGMCIHHFMSDRSLKDGLYKPAPVLPTAKPVAVEPAVPLHCSAKLQEMGKWKLAVLHVSAALYCKNLF